MKKGILIVVGLLLTLFFSGCGDITASVLCSPNEFEDAETEYQGRIGLCVDQMELGICSNYWPNSSIDQTYGAYILQNLADPNGMGLLGKPFAGVMATLAVDDNGGGMYAFLTGTVHEVEGIKIRTEFQYRSYSDYLKEDLDEGTDKYKVFVGPVFNF